jgi:hydroxypyruvate reductase
MLLGTNHQALIAAETAAEDLGYQTVTLTSRLVGEAREAARFLASIIAEARLHDRPAAPPCCILAGGETTVTIRGTGKGGRNQELTLAMLGAMADSPETFEGVGFASVATDGTDGPTDAAGAFASTGIAARATESGRNIAEYLVNNDSFHFFEALGELYRTGPTQTNVCDIQIALVGTPE